MTPQQLAQVYDFENIVETAVKQMLTDNAIPSVFVSGDSPDFERVKPRVELAFKLGTAHLKWVEQGSLPQSLKGLKINFAWKATLETLISCGSALNDKQTLAAWRAQVRYLFLNLDYRVNSKYLTYHSLILPKEAGCEYARHPESGYEQTKFMHEMDFQIRATAWNLLA
jgi:hypothetical protein